ncbi:helix-turn-helix domain-containing protein [Arachidicoccus ginsenosidivorans]
MKHLTILVPAGQGNNLSSIVGPFKIFSRANAIAKAQKGREIFKIELAGLSEEVDFYEGLFAVRPQKNITDIKKTDLIIIPSLNHHYEAAVGQNKLLADWIWTRYHDGAQVAAICTGAFLLAATGLLNGKPCSTHWSAAADFKNRFPKVQLQIDQVITDQDGLYTSGGAYSFLNLIIYLVEKYFDRQIAILCAKIFQVEIDRDNQSVFSIFTGQKAHEDEVVRNVQLYIEENYADKVSFSSVSKKFAVGRRNFDRRFIKATGNTPVEYLQRVRVESAKKLLESTQKQIIEVMYEAGYSDVKAFREVFRKVTGLTPLDYKNKYNRVAAF